jgi:hypothetical protein
VSSALFGGHLAASRMSPQERKARAQLAANESWKNTEDRRGRTAKARAAFDEKFYDEVDPDHGLPDAEREKRAANARKAYFARLALKSATAARRRRECNGGAG